MKKKKIDTDVCRHVADKYIKQTPTNALTCHQITTVLSLKPLGSKHVAVMCNVNNVVTYCAREFVGV